MVVDAEVRASTMAADLAAAHSEMENQLEVARAQHVSLQKERDLVVLALAQREHTAQERDAMMHAATMALAAQRDEAAAARNVATAREADLAQALANASARVAALEADAVAVRATAKQTSLHLEKKGQEATKLAEAAHRVAARAEVLEARLAHAEGQASALRRQLQAACWGRTFAAVAACALAIGCSAVVGRSGGTSSRNTTTVK